MAVRKPEDDDIIEAELVEEEPVIAVPEPPKPAPQPPRATPPPPEPEPFVLTPVEPAPAARPAPKTPVPGPFVARNARREKPPTKNSGLGLVVLLLIAVLIAGIIWRVEITAFYNRHIGPIFGSEAPAPEPVKETPKVPAPTPAAPTPAAKSGAELPNPEIPKFDRREPPGPAPKEPEETPAVVRPAPAPEPAPGLAYSIVGRTNVSGGELQQFEIKVVVPASYKCDDLTRMARAIVASERRLGERHAIRLLCFTDPDKTKPDDLFATVDWGPGGDFMKAADAVNKGSDKNEFTVRLKR